MTHVCSIAHAGRLLVALSGCVGVWEFSLRWSWRCSLYLLKHKFEIASAVALHQCCFEHVAVQPPCARRPLHLLAMLRQAPWCHGMFPWWFDNSVLYECKFEASTQYIDKVDHRSFFWTFV